MAAKVRVGRGIWEWQMADAKFLTLAAWSL